MQRGITYVAAGNGRAAFVDVEDVSCGRLKCTYREWT